MDYRIKELYAHKEQHEKEACRIDDFLTMLSMANFDSEQLNCAIAWFNHSKLKPSEIYDKVMN